MRTPLIAAALLSGIGALSLARPAAAAPMAPAPSLVAGQHPILDVRTKKRKVVRSGARRATPAPGTSGGPSTATPGAPAGSTGGNAATGSGAAPTGR